VNWFFPFGLPQASTVPHEEKAVSNQRKKIWIDRFQTRLFLRIAFHFILYQVGVWALVAIVGTLYRLTGRVLGPESAAGSFALLSAILAITAGLFIYDAIKFSHRLVGPLYRVRQTIKAVIAGEEVPLVRFRQGDFLEDLRDDLNEMLKALEQRGAVTLKPDTAEQRQEQPVAV
jgi:hypothetical protein